MVKLKFFIGSDYFFSLLFLYFLTSFYFFRLSLSKKKLLSSKKVTLDDIKECVKSGKIMLRNFSKEFISLGGSHKIPFYIVSGGIQGF